MSARWNPASQPQAFDAVQRDRQARGKDPYARSEDEATDDSDSSAGEKPLRLGQGISQDSFQDRERRAFALSVLDRPELLTMYAQSTNDSIPSQRHRFTAMLCGYAPELKPIRQRGRNAMASDSSAGASEASASASASASAAARDAREGAQREAGGPSREGRHAQRGGGAGPSGQ